MLVLTQRRIGLIPLEGHNLWRGKQERSKSTQIIFVPIRNLTPNPTKVLRKQDKGIKRTKQKFQRLINDMLDLLIIILKFLIFNEIFFIRSMTRVLDMNNNFNFTKYMGPISLVPIKLDQDCDSIQLNQIDLVLSHLTISTLSDITTSRAFLKLASSSSTISYIE